MQRPARNGQHGFSMIELTVAMAITLIVSGAIYGLLAGGQSAFRREPELSDRQQNIRVAMDMIQRDIANAGSGLPDFVQSFTPGLDACAACPMGPDGVPTDELEILTNAAVMDNEQVCFQDPGFTAGDALWLVRSAGTVAADTPVVLIMANGQWTMRNIVTVATDPALVGPVPPFNNCTDATPHLLLGLGTAGDTSAMNVAGTLCTPSALGMGNVVAPCRVAEVSFGEIVRYRIRPDADGVPVLQRSSSADAAAGFQTLARGIENLQIQYDTATLGDVWIDDAPPVLPGTFASIITQVRVTLAARSEAQNVQGATDAAAGPTAMRGQLTATASPRSSLLALTREPLPPSPAPPVNLWR